MTPGHIADQQAWVTYAPRGGSYKILAPLGWARTESGGKVTFANKLDGESVQVSSGACTAGDPRTTLSKMVLHSGAPVTDLRVGSIALPAGPAHLAEYQTTSREPATGKRVPVTANAYFLERDGRCALITFWSPVGAGNEAYWQETARSFRWR